MSDVQLTTGAIQQMKEQDRAGNQELSHEPVLQVLSVKLVQTATNPVQRYRIIISDGQYFMQAMIATQLNELLTSDPPAFDKMSVIRLDTYACNVVQGRRIVIVLGLTVIATGLEKIGSPISLEPAPGAAAAAGTSGSNAARAEVPKPIVKKSAPPKGNAPVYPIEGLSPYQNKWTIKARVTVKSDVRTWSNAKGEGKLFSVNLLDETGEIKATGFGDACDKLYPIFEEGKVYYISKARVNIAKKQFSNLNSEYEIMFESGTEVTLCEDQDSAPQIQYNFIELANLESLEKDATCDVLGIVKDNGSLDEITAKASQKQLKKRELTIVDRSGYSVRVTLWGKSAENWVDATDGVFAFKSAKVGDFGGRTLSMGGQSTMTADPDIPEAHDLRGWYDTEGNGTTFNSYSNNGGGGAASFRKEEFITIDVTKADNYAMGEKPEYFSTRASVLLVKETGTISYPACPTPGCNKKVAMEDSNRWRCEKCDKTYEKPEYRYIISLCIGDHTDRIWISTFNEVGLQLFGATADEMEHWKDNEDPRYVQTIKRANGQMFNFGCRAKAESYNDVTKVRFHATKLSAVDWAESAMGMVKDIKSYGY